MTSSLYPAADWSGVASRSGMSSGPVRRGDVYRGFGKAQGGRGDIWIARYGAGSLNDWLVSWPNCGMLEVGTWAA